MIETEMTANFSVAMNLNFVTFIGFEDSNSNVMIVPKEMLQESLQNAQADWLTRQRSIESLWINSGNLYKVLLLHA